MTRESNQDTITERDKHKQAWNKTIRQVLTMTGGIAVVAASVWTLRMLYLELEIGRILDAYGSLISAILPGIMIALMSSIAVCVLLLDQKRKNFRKLFGYDDPTIRKRNTVMHEICETTKDEV